MLGDFKSQRIQILFIFKVCKFIVDTLYMEYGMFINQLVREIWGF